MEEPTLVGASDEDRESFRMLFSLCSLQKCRFVRWLKWSMVAMNTYDNHILKGFNFDTISSLMMNLRS